MPVEVVRLSAFVMLAAADWCGFEGWCHGGYLGSHLGEPVTALQAGWMRGSEPEECPWVLTLESQRPRAGRGHKAGADLLPGLEQMAACSLPRRWLGSALCGKACYSPFLVSCLTWLAVLALKNKHLPLPSFPFEPHCESEELMDRIWGISEFIRFLLSHSFNLLFDLLASYPPYSFWWWPQWSLKNSSNIKSVYCRKLSIGFLFPFWPQSAAAWCGVSVLRPGIEPGLQ